MFGPSGALPLHMTEYARDRARNLGDMTLVRFVDLFHHRMLSLYYRAWAAAQPTVSFDRPSADRFSVNVASLFGLGMTTLRDRDGMPDLAKLHFSGRLALQTRNAEGLREIIADYFKLPVEIEQFLPDWVRLPRQSLCLLRRVPMRPARWAPPRRSASDSASIITNSASASGRMTFADFCRLLPDGQKPVAPRAAGAQLHR